jgi:hypothetical protein
VIIYLVWLSILTSVIWDVVVSIQTGGLVTDAAPWWVFLPVYVLAMYVVVPFLLAGRAMEGRPEKPTPGQAAGEGEAPGPRREFSWRAPAWVAWVFLASGVPLFLGAAVYRICVGPGGDALPAESRIWLGLLLTFSGLAIVADRRVPGPRRELSSRVTTWVAWVLLASGVSLFHGAAVYRICVGPAADALLGEGGIAFGVLLTVFGFGIAAHRRVKDRGGKADPKTKG